jgi:hypothetical protein
MSKLDEAAMAHVNKDAGFLGPWDIKTFSGYPCPHCMHQAEKDFINGAKWLLAEVHEELEELRGACWDEHHKDKIVRAAVIANLARFENRIKKLTED